MILLSSHWLCSSEHLCRMLCALFRTGSLLISLCRPKPALVMAALRQPSCGPSTCKDALRAPQHCSCGMQAQPTAVRCSTCCMPLAKLSNLYIAAMRLPRCICGWPLVHCTALHVSTTCQLAQQASALAAQALPELERPAPFYSVRCAWHSGSE